MVHAFPEDRQSSDFAHRSGDGFQEDTDTLPEVHAELESIAKERVEKWRGDERQKEIVREGEGKVDEA